MGFAHTHLKPFWKKGFKNSKNFQRGNYLLSYRGEYEQTEPSKGKLLKVFAPYRCLGCDITLRGKVSQTDGKVLPQAFWMAVPKCLREYLSVRRRNFPIQADVTLKQGTVAKLSHAKQKRVMLVRTTLGRTVILFHESFGGS